jgi:hypothetical protein
MAGVDAIEAVLLKSVALPAPSCCMLNVEPPIVKF